MDLVFAFVELLIVFVDFAQENRASQRFLASLELPCTCMDFRDLLFLRLKVLFVLVEVLDGGRHDFLVQSPLNWVILAPDVEFIIDDVEHVQVFFGSVFVN